MPQVSIQVQQQQNLPQNLYEADTNPALSPKSSGACKQAALV